MLYFIFGTSNMRFPNNNKAFLLFKPFIDGISEVHRALQSSSLSTVKFFQGLCVYGRARARSIECARLLGVPGQKRPVSQFVLDADSGPSGARRPPPVYLPANERQ